MSTNTGVNSPWVCRSSEAGLSDLVQKGFLVRVGAGGLANAYSYQASPEGLRHMVLCQLATFQDTIKHYSRPVPPGIQPDSLEFANSRTRWELLAHLESTGWQGCRSTKGQSQKHVPHGNKVYYFDDTHLSREYLQVLYMAEAMFAKGLKEIEHLQPVNYTTLLHHLRSRPDRLASVKPNQPRTYYVELQSGAHVPDTSGSASCGLEEEPPGILQLPPPNPPKRGRGRGRGRGRKHVNMKPNTAVAAPHSTTVEDMMSIMMGDSSESEGGYPINHPGSEAEKAVELSAASASAATTSIEVCAQSAEISRADKASIPNVAKDLHDVHVGAAVLPIPELGHLSAIESQPGRSKELEAEEFNLDDAAMTSSGSRDKAQHPLFGAAKNSDAVVAAEPVSEIDLDFVPKASRSLPGEGDIIPSAKKQKVHDSKTAVSISNPTNISSILRRVEGIGNAERTTMWSLDTIWFGNIPLKKRTDQKGSSGDSCLMNSFICDSTYCLCALAVFS